MVYELRVFFTFLKQYKNINKPENVQQDCQWPTRSKILAIWPITEKVCYLWTRLWNTYFKSLKDMNDEIKYIETTGNLCGK